MLAIVMLTLVSQGDTDFIDVDCSLSRAAFFDLDHFESEAASDPRPEGVRTTGCRFCPDDVSVWQLTRDETVPDCALPAGTLLETHNDSHDVQGMILPRGHQICDGLFCVDTVFYRFNWASGPDGPNRVITLTQPAEAFGIRFPAGASLNLEPGLVDQLADFRSPAAMTLPGVHFRGQPIDVPAQTLVRLAPDENDIRHVSMAIAQNRTHTFSLRGVTANLKPLFRFDSRGNLIEVHAREWMLGPYGLSGSIRFDERGQIQSAHSLAPIDIGPVTITSHTHFDEANQPVFSYTAIEMELGGAQIPVGTGVRIAWNGDQALVVEAVWADPATEASGPSCFRVCTDQAGQRDFNAPSRVVPARYSFRDGSRINYFPGTYPERYRLDGTLEAAQHVCDVIHHRLGNQLTG